MGRRPCCAKEGLNRGAWSAKEDRILIEYIENHGEGKWRDLPKRAGLKRCGKSCRLRWLNYLRPDIKRGNISPEEEDLILRLHKLLGNRWSLIAGRLPGRTDNEIKNYWNTNLSRKAPDVSRRFSPHDNGSRSSRRKNEVEKEQSGEASPTSLESHEVIRTKAVRCTKVFISQADDRGETGASLSSWFKCPAFSPPDDDESLDFLMNVDMGQLLISDVLGCEEVVGCGGESRRSSDVAGDDDPALELSDVMLQDWSACDPFRANVPSDVNMWSTFLDPEHEQENEQ